MALFEVAIRIIIQSVFPCSVQVQFTGVDNK